jgi:hypothetical protein
LLGYGKNLVFDNIVIFSGEQIHLILDFSVDFLVPITFLGFLQHFLSFLGFFLNSLDIGVEFLEILSAELTVDILLVGSDRGIRLIVLEKLSFVLSLNNREEIRPHHFEFGNFVVNNLLNDFTCHSYDLIDFGTGNSLLHRDLFNFDFRLFHNLGLAELFFFSFFLHFFHPWALSEL